MKWTNEQMQRVAAAVVERRGSATQDEVVAKAGSGLSKPVLSIIENARQDSFKPRTLLALCRGLGWTPDSIDRILDGQPPREVDNDLDAPSGSRSTARPTRKPGNATPTRSPAASVKRTTASRRPSTPARPTTRRTPPPDRRTGGGGVARAEPN